MPKLLPLHAITTGIQTTSALAGALTHTATTVAEIAGAVGSAAFEIATAPVRAPMWEGARVLAGTTPTRRCWRGDGRAWIEVRGLSSPGGAQRQRVVLESLRVQTLERTGRVCAMVGDGSNDAAAIRAATVGVGVVAHGSDPAHTAADVVLTDGRIESLLHAVEERRRLWRRVQAAVSVLLGGNASQVIFAIIGSALTGNSPLNARQLLLMNVFTDALPGAALAVIMPSGPVRRAGRGPDERTLWRAVGIRGVSQLLGCMPVGPLGWAQGLGPAVIATVAMAAVTRLAAGRRDSQPPAIDSWPDHQSRDHGRRTEDFDCADRQVRPASRTFTTTSTPASRR